MEIPFCRTLTGGEVGLDVEGIGRALCKADVGYVSLRTFNAMPATWRRTYGSRKVDAVNAIRKLEGWTQNGDYTPKVQNFLVDQGCFDAYSVNLLVRYDAAHAYERCHPIPRGYSFSGGSYLHPTAGLVGNWALDWIVPEISDGRRGAPILAVVDAKITRLSGSPPSADGADASGVYGWSIHYESAGGYRWFWTHFGERANLIEGQRVRAGEIVGWIGDQRYRPDHIHGGVTSPLGEADAKRTIKRVAEAARVLPRT